jgi:uncharacterized protein (TIGR03118 family)
MFIHPLEPRTLFSHAGVAVTNLVSDGAPGLPAAHTDANLKNPWGVSFQPGQEWWVSDNGTGVSTLYAGTGAAFPLVVSIPAAGGGGASSAPTGQVANTTSGFVVHGGGGVSGPAQFIFVGEDGGITGWNPSVDATHAVMAVDQSAQGSVFKGAALGTRGGKPFLFAADFRNGAVDTFDSNFAPFHRRGMFADPQIPAGFAPFNVQNVGGALFVTYARQDAAKHDDVAGSGNGFVDEFDTAGRLIMRLQHVSTMNSPWGVAQAPASWGAAAGDLLVGQFGSGEVLEFNARRGTYLGLLRRAADNRPVREDGLWALQFADGGQTGSPNTLFFTAGPNEEADGLFGSMTFQAGSTSARRHRTTSSTGSTGMLGY